MGSPSSSGEIVVAWAATPDAAGLATRTALELTGRHPGPLHHLCPSCGSIEHGRPSFDAPVEVSIARAGGTSLVAVSTAGPVGVDLEAEGATDHGWVRAEAIGKAYGVGITGRTGPAAVAGLTVPGYVAMLAVIAPAMPNIRMLPVSVEQGEPEAPAAPARP